MSSNTGGTRNDRFLKQAAIGWIAATVILEVFKWLFRSIVWCFLSVETKARITTAKAKKKRKERRDNTEITRLIKRLF